MAHNVLLFQLRSADFVAILSFFNNQTQQEVHGTPESHAWDMTVIIYTNPVAYSFNKITGSLTKLQRAMGHSSLLVSLTYLRGLEVTELKEEDMPVIHTVVV